MDTRTSEERSEAAKKANYTRSFLKFGDDRLDEVVRNILFINADQDIDVDRDTADKPSLVPDEATFIETATETVMVLTGKTSRSYSSSDYTDCRAYVESIRDQCKKNLADFEADIGITQQPDPGI